MVLTHAIKYTANIKGSEADRIILLKHKIKRLVGLDADACRRWIWIDRLANVVGIFPIKNIACWLKNIIIGL